jgi:hypothetical protein
MAENSVAITKLPKVPIGKSDVIFQIETDEGKLGKLRVSKGSVYWVPTSGQYGYYLTWSEFNDLMTKKGTRRKYKF